MSEYSFFRIVGHSRLMALVRTVCHTLDEFLEGDELLPREIEVEMLLHSVYDERIPYATRDNLMSQLDVLYDKHWLMFSSFCS